MFISWGWLVGVGLGSLTWEGWLGLVGDELVDWFWMGLVGWGWLVAWFVDCLYSRPAGLTYSLS